MISGVNFFLSQAEVKKHSWISKLTPPNSGFTCNMAQVNMWTKNMTGHFYRINEVWRGSFDSYEKEYIFWAVFSSGNFNVAHFWSKLPLARAGHKNLLILFFLFYLCICCVSYFTNFVLNLSLPSGLASKFSGLHFLGAPSVIEHVSTIPFPLTVVQNGDHFDPVHL